MKSVILEGVLGERFGREWALDVLTPAEALRAIDANRPGFLKYVAESNADHLRYQILLDDEVIPVDRVLGPFSSREVFRVVPVVSGAEGEGKTILGFVLIVAAIALAPASGGTSLGMATPIIGGFTYTSLAMLGAAMVLGGISMAMAGQPKAGAGGDDVQSYLYNGPVNTVTQGGPVPVGYGRVLCGSVVISGGITVDEMRVMTSRDGGGNVRFIPE